MQFFDVETSDVFGTDKWAVPGDHEVGLEMRPGTRAILSARMDSTEARRARQRLGVEVELDVPTGAIDWSEVAARARGSSVEGEEVGANLERIGAPGAWKRTNGEGAVVAVIDTGIYRGHSDLLVGKALTFVPHTTSSDQRGHGTQVAGVVAARRNQTGMIGVAPCATLYSLKALNDEGRGVGGWLLAAARWCAKERVDVANLSLKVEGRNAILESELSQMADEMLIVAAAGNRIKYKPQSVVAPARYKNIIAVSAVDKSDGLSDLSCFRTRSRRGSAWNFHSHDFPPRRIPGQ